MRKRNVHIQFWLNRKEAEALDKKVRRSGLSREAYLRHLIDGVVPQDAPPPDYFSMMRELHGVANNLNQIAQVEAAIKKITEAVVLPKPMEHTGTPQSRKALWGEEHPRSDEHFDACGKSGKRSAV